MKLDVHCQGLPDEQELRTLAERRLTFAVGRFGDQIQRIALKLSDENGPRGGEHDKHCRVHLTLRPRGQILLEGHGNDARALLDRVCNRMSHAVRRELERRRS